VRDAVEVTMTRGDGDGGDGGDGGDVDECELDGVIARAFTSSDASTTGEATARLDAYKVRACVRACDGRTDGRTDGGVIGVRMKMMMMGGDDVCD
jgi:hypothetical protein